MWADGIPLRIWIDGPRLDILAHHAIFDGVRGVELINRMLGNEKREGAIRPHSLPSCAYACGPVSLARVLTCDRHSAGLEAVSADYHESHYLQVKTDVIKLTKKTHGLGFAVSLQGMLLWALLRCGVAKSLSVACTVGFKSDRWARLGSMFNHYGAFPFTAKGEGAQTPQALAQHITTQSKRNGYCSGFACLLANAHCGGDFFSKLYNSIGAPGPCILKGVCHPGAPHGTY
jgi:hypothetical protein